MNIVNEQVSHILYGEGKVINQESNVIFVQFSEKYGMRKFVYPDAFEKYLKLGNHDAEISVLKELHDKQALIEEKELEEQQKYEEVLKSIQTKKPKPTTRKKKSPQKSKFPEEEHYEADLAEE